MLTALIVTSLVCGALLLASVLAMESWHSRSYYQAQVASSGSTAVQVENPYEDYETPMSAYIGLFFACCAVATFWAVFVVLPSLFTLRRMFSTSRAGHVVAAGVVFVISGAAFALLGGPARYMPAAVPIAVGGAIGLVSLLLLAWALPPNTSLERSRGR